MVAGERLRPPRRSVLALTVGPPSGASVRLAHARGTPASGEAASWSVQTLAKELLLARESPRRKKRADGDLGEVLPPTEGSRAPLFFQ